jgi:hypothetical protein
VWRGLASLSPYWRGVIVFLATICAVTVDSRGGFRSF